MRVPSTYLSYRSTYLLAGLRVALVIAAAGLAVVACGGGDDGGGGGNGDGGPGGGEDAAGAGDILIAFDRDGDMWELDPATGTGTEILNTTYDGAADIGVVSSAFYLPDKDQLWLGMGDRSECAACIFSLDLSSGAATLLSDNIDALETGVSGLARSPLGGFLFTVKGADRFFYGINPDTALPQLIGGVLPGVGRGAGVSFNDSEVLYAALENKLYTIGVNDGAATEIAIFNAVGFSEPQENFVINSMAWLNGTMYGLFRADNKDTYLVTINLADATVTLIAQSPERMEGVATLPAGKRP